MSLIGCRESKIDNDFHQEATHELLTSHLGDAEIDTALAAFIQRLMTTPEKRLRSLYTNTNNPNIPALREIKPNSDIIDSSMMSAQNCMLKGVTKVAHIMDAIYKNIDRVPPEMNLRSSMSNFNDAMRFFAAANLERSQNIVLLASTQAVYKAPHSTVRGHSRPESVQDSQSSSSSGSSRKSQSVRLEHNT